MSKDSFWFSHDSNARNDPKLAKLLFLGGQEAKGCFWDLIEIMRESDGYKIDKESLEAISYQCRFPVGVDVVGMMINCDLLCEDNDHVWSASLIRRMEEWDKTKEARRKAGKRGGKAKARNHKAKPVPSKALAKLQQSSSKPLAKLEQSPSKALAKLKQSSSKPLARREEDRIEEDRIEERKREEKKREEKSITKAVEPKPGVAVWRSYAAAYAQRYSCEPLRDAKVNTHCLQLVKRLGIEIAPQVASYYVGLNNSYYIAKRHQIGLLVTDAEKVYSEWMTGQSVTTTQAREADRLSTQGNEWAEVIAQRGE